MHVVINKLEYEEMFNDMVILLFAVYWILIINWKGTLPVWEWLRSVSVSLNWHCLVDMQGKDTKDGSGRFSALSSCDSPRQDDLDDVDYHFDVDDVDTPVSQPRYV
jgi:hypothetical protein